MILEEALPSPPTPITFLDAAQEGKTGWLRYLAGVFLIVFLWLIVGSVPLLLAVAFVSVDADANTAVNLRTGLLAGVDPLWNFVLPMANSAMLFFGVALAATLVHRRRWISLITAAKAIDFRRLGQGFGVWLVLAATSALVEALTHPSRYQWSLDATRLLLFLPLALLLIPIQTSGEELLFRGYLLQAAGGITRRPLILVMLSGFVFMLPHLGNPEVSANVGLLSLFYFAFGAFLALVSIKDGRLELALGVHAANNLFAALIANYEGSALQTPAALHVAVLDPVYNLISTVVSLALFYLVFFGPRRTLRSPVG